MSLKHAILILLETEPGSGYDLFKHFKNSLGYFWNAKHQQVYQQLKVLTNEELIEFTTASQTGKPDKKVYAITQKGVSELKNWLEQPVKPNKINDALLVKLYGGHLTSENSLAAELDRHIEIHEAQLKELLGIEETFKHLSADKRQKFRLPFLTLRRGIYGERAWLEWAKEAKAELAEGE